MNLWLDEDERTEQGHDTRTEHEAGYDEDDLLPRASVVVRVEDELVGLR